MKYIKKFDNEAQLETYKKNNFITPHVYLDSNLNTVKFMQEYKQLEYISSTKTGGQYIDLGCQLMENTDDIQIDIKFNIKGYGKDRNNNKQATLIASQPEISPYPGFVLRKQANNNVDYMIELCTKWAFTNSTKQAAATRYDSMFLSYQQTDSTIWVKRNWNNIYEFTEILDSIPNSQVNNTTCTLFCALNGSNIPFRFCEADLYYLKFTKGGQVIRNLIPVKKVSTNEIGLYDMENDYLYVSQGNEPFEGGPIINN